MAGVRLDNLVPADQPPVLISQLPRSGGTLLMRLFDGHPECHTFPHELGGGIASLGKPLPPNAGSEQAWRILHNPKLTGWARKGYPITQRKNSSEKALIRMKLQVDPELQKQIFLESYPEEFSERGAHAAYHTSYFNAWLDNRNLEGRKKWVVSFEPRAILSRQEGTRYVDRFNDLYPDGRIISVVRDPQSWLVSAQGWAVKETEKTGSLASAVEAWRSGVEELLQIHKETPDRMAIVRFSNLLEDTPATMLALTAWLGIDNARQSSVPTFNGRPAEPNTSFKIDGKGVAKDPLRRGDALSKSDRREIDGLAGDLMDRVAECSLSGR